MKQELINKIASIVDLSAEEKEWCATYFELLRVGKGLILEEQNRVPGYLYFILSGFMRLFYLDEDGAEVTTAISGANCFFASFLSLVKQERAKENAACITDCEILRISRPDLLELIGRSEKFKKFSLIIFEEAIASAESRANDLANLTGMQRYEKLIKNHPAILQFVPIQYISSYLGIQRQSLSRIRRQIMAGSGK